MSPPPKTPCHPNSEPCTPQARPKLAQGAGLLFNSTEPHRHPGVMVSEGPRETVYIGYQGLQLEADSSAPVVAHPASRMDDKGTEYTLAFDAKGRYTLDDAMRKSAVKREETAKAQGKKVPRSPAAAPRVTSMDFIEAKRARTAGAASTSSQ